MYGKVTFAWAGDKSEAILTGSPPHWAVSGGVISSESAAELMNELNRRFNPLTRYNGPQYGQFAARVVPEAAEFLGGTAEVPVLPTVDGVEY